MNNSLKITHVIMGRCGRENKSGVYKSVYSFVTHQAELGHDVKLVCVTKKEVELINDIEVVAVKPPFFSLLGSKELTENVVEGSPDVIHLHSAYVPVNIAVGRIARNHNISYVVTPHGNASPSLMKRRPYLKYPYKYFFERPLLRRAMCVHTIADSRDVKRYGVDTPMVTAVNGIDCPEDYLQHEDLPGLRRYNVPKGKTSFLFLGRLDIPQKGLDSLVDGFAEAYQLNQDIHLVLAGSDWDGGRKCLETIVDKYSLRDAVTFTGPVFGEEKHGLLRDCDFFVHTSRWEAGIPFSVLEGLSYGKSVMVTNQVDRDGQLADRSLASIVQQDSTSISSAILELVALDSEEIEKRREEAREFLLAEFSWSKSAKNLIDGYFLHLADR